MIQAEVLRECLVDMLDQYRRECRPGARRAVESVLEIVEDMEAAALDVHAPHDRHQLAVRMCLACGMTANDHLASCRTRQAGDTP